MPQPLEVVALHPYPFDIGVPPGGKVVPQTRGLEILLPGAQAAASLEPTAQLDYENGTLKTSCSDGGGFTTCCW